MRLQSAITINLKTILTRALGIFMWRLIRDLSSLCHGGGGIKRYSFAVFKRRHKFRIWRVSYTRRSSGDKRVREPHGWWANRDSRIDYISTMCIMLPSPLESQQDAHVVQAHWFRLFLLVNPKEFSSSVQNYSEVSREDTICLRTAMMKLDLTVCCFIALLQDTELLAIYTFFLKTTLNSYKWYVTHILFFLSFINFA